jgi:hypothetical protein
MHIRSFLPALGTTTGLASHRGWWTSCKKPALSSFLISSRMKFYRSTDRPSIGVDLQMVLDHLPRDPGHLRWLPCKHIRVSLEEGDEREFLFAVQITRDTGSLSSIGPNLNGHGDVLSCRELHMGCWG